MILLVEIRLYHVFVFASKNTVGCGNLYQCILSSLKQLKNKRKNKFVKAIDPCHQGGRRAFDYSKLSERK